MGLFGSAKKDASRAPPPSLGLGLQLASGSATAAAAALSNGERRIAPSSSASSAHGSFDSGYSRIDAPASLRSANGVAGQEAWRASTPSKKKEKTSKKAKARQMEDYLRQQQLEQFFNAPKQPPRPSDRLELSNLREGSDDEGKGSRTHIARFSINGMLALVESKMAFEEEQGMRSRERRRPAAPNVEPSPRSPRNIPNGTASLEDEQELLSSPHRSGTAASASTMSDYAGSRLVLNPAGAAYPHTRLQHPGMASRRDDPPISVSSVLSEAASLRDEVSDLLNIARKASHSSESDAVQGVSTAGISDTLDAGHQRKKDRHKKAGTFGRLFTRSKAAPQQEEESTRALERLADDVPDAATPSRRRVQSTSGQDHRQFQTNRSDITPLVPPLPAPTSSSVRPAAHLASRNASPASHTRHPHAEAISPTSTFQNGNSVQLDGPLTKTYGEDMFSRPAVRALSPSPTDNLSGCQGSRISHGRKRSLSTPNPIPKHLYRPQAARPPLPSARDPGSTQQHSGRSQAARATKPGDWKEPVGHLRQVDNLRFTQTTPTPPDLPQAQYARYVARDTGHRRNEASVALRSAPLAARFTARMGESDGRSSRERSNSDASMVDPAVVPPILEKYGQKSEALTVNSPLRALIAGPIGPPPTSPLPPPPTSTPPRSAILHDDAELAHEAASRRSLVTVRGREHAEQTSRCEEIGDRKDDRRNTVRCAHSSIISAYQRDSPRSHAATSPRPGTGDSVSQGSDQYNEYGTSSTSTHSSARFSDRSTLEGRARGDSSTVASSIRSSTLGRWPSLSVDGSHCTTVSSCSYPSGPLHVHSDRGEDSGSDYSDHDEQQSRFPGHPSLTSGRQLLYRQRSREMFRHLDGSGVREVNEDEL